jgi:hypothetical protein
MRWRIRRIVNGCAAQELVARRDMLASHPDNEPDRVYLCNRSFANQQSQRLLFSKHCNYNGFQVVPMRTEKMDSFASSISV